MKVFDLLPHLLFVPVLFQAGLANAYDFGSSRLDEQSIVRFIPVADHPTQIEIKRCAKQKPDQCAKQLVGGRSFSTLEISETFNRIDEASHRLHHGFWGTTAKAIGSCVGGGLVSGNTIGVAVATTLQVGIGPVVWAVGAGCILGAGIYLYATHSNDQEPDQLSALKEGLTPNELVVLPFGSTDEIIALLREYLPK